MVVVPDRVTPIGRQSSVCRAIAFVLEIGQPGTVTAYCTLIVVFPVPLKVIIVPFKEPGPERSVKTPPVGLGIKSTDEPLQYNPPAPNVGAPVILTSKFVAPQINTTAVAKVYADSFVVKLVPSPILPPILCPTYPK